MYQFKLEALLTHRRHQEESCQKELAEVRRKLADEQDKLGRKRREKRENVQKLQQLQRESTAVSDLILYVNYVQQLSKDIENQTRRVQEVTKKVNQKRNALVLVMQKRKILEKLKDKDRQAQQKKLMQGERKLMDEIASIRHVRGV